MHKIELSYSLGGQRSTDALIRNQLMDLLHTVREQGSISAAARVLNLSYRHVWGELKRWEQVLQRELILWERGQSARLSDFGEKLLWAERQAQARLSPQIEALQADLERAFAVAFDDSAHVLTLYASHDDALVTLREYAQSQGALHLDIRFAGSVDAIRSLNEGRCLMAGFHTLTPSSPGSLAHRIYKPLLRPGLHKIIGFALRHQGLMVPRGNPLQLRTLADVVHARARFANRARGCATRVVLDELLAQAQIAPDHLLGYEHTEPAHAAVAQAVAFGQADVGLGIASVASARGLDFVPLAQERYHLVCLKSALSLPSVVALRSLLQSRPWQDRLGGIADHVPAQCGEVLSMRRTLPWWDFKRPKPQVL